MIPKNKIEDFVKKAGFDGVVAEKRKVWKEIMSKFYLEQVGDNFRGIITYSFNQDKLLKYFGGEDGFKKWSKKLKTELKEFLPNFLPRIEIKDEGMFYIDLELNKI